MSNVEPRELIARWIADPAVSGTNHVPAFSFDVGIPNYRNRVRAYYPGLEHVLDKLCTLPDFGEIPTDFGLRINFERPVHARIHDEDLVLDERLRELMHQYGPVSLVNISTSPCPKGNEQRNIFPNLQFHIDRAGDQPNQVSMFLRDPGDPMHRDPRRTSSIFVANAVGHLQALAEGASLSENRKASYKIFDNESAETAIGNIIYEHDWQAPQGTGEIVLLDNRTLLHASYHREERGYPIGVRYLY